MATLPPIWTATLVRCFCLEAMLWAGLAGADSEPPREPFHSVGLSAPRTFGYVLGDVIEHEIAVSIERPYTLETALLPKPGQVNEWLEVRAVDTRGRRQKNRNDYVIGIRYQIFRATKATEAVTIPAVPLHFHSDAGSFEDRTPAWQFTLAPLIPSRARDDEIVIRPDREPMPYAVAPSVRVLGLSLAGVLAVSCYLAWRCDALPFRNRNRGPFANALRAMQQLGKRPPAAESYRAALRLLHRALNDTAGETVFAGRLEHFFRHQPAFAASREKLARFFRLSQQMFFTSPAPPIPNEYPLAWLETLCRECRAIERNSR